MEAAMRPYLLAGASLLAFLALAGASATSAEDPAALFKDRSVFMEIGYSPGGAYDVYARAVGVF